jgi:hypothetical protein
VRIPMSSRRSEGRLAPFLLSSFLLLVPAITWGAPIPYGVVLDTTTLAGTGAQVAFDFIDGGSPANTAVISGFATNGTLGSFATIGSVTGNLPSTITLADTSFFNEYLHNLTLGTTLSFLLSTTANGPSGASSPDSFSFFLINPISELSLVPTSDPTGANALFKLDIDGSPQGQLSVYSVSGGQISVSVTPVPEPSVLLLMLTGLASLLLRHHVRHSTLKE